VNGEEDNVLYYYDILVREHSERPLGTSSPDGAKSSS
jgi:hypothetical protein